MTLGAVRNVSSDWYHNVQQIPRRVEEPMIDCRPRRWEEEQHG